MTGEVEFRQYEGATGGRGLQWIDTIDRVQDRKSLRGIKSTPFNMGSNEFIAESSAEAQMILWGIRMNVYQDIAEQFISDNARVPLLIEGIADPVECRIERMRDWQRLEQSQVFKELVGGIVQLTAAGVPFPAAVKVCEEMTGQQLSPGVHRELAKVVMKDTDTDTNTDTDTKEA